MSEDRCEKILEELKNVNERVDQLIDEVKESIKNTFDRKAIESKRKEDEKVIQELGWRLDMSNEKLQESENAEAVIQNHGKTKGKRLIEYFTKEEQFIYSSIKQDIYKCKTKNDFEY